jgi:hypothetical protein
MANLEAIEGTHPPPEREVCMSSKLYNRSARVLASVDGMFLRQFILLPPDDMGCRFSGLGADAIMFVASSMPVKDIRALVI